MSWEGLYSLLNLSAVFGWLLLIAAPRHWRLLGLVPRYVVPGAIAVVYSGLMAAHYAQSGGGYGSLEAVRRLMAHDPVLLAGWAHFLAFDLVVGVLLAERMDRVGVGRVLQAPALIATFLFGPIGWLLGLATEAGARWRGRLVAEA